jgi:hypothetical protein
MSVRSKHLTLLGVAGAAALTVSAFAAPALAAPTDLTYTCDAPVGATSVTFDPGTIPATMVAGQKQVNDASLTVHLNAAQTGLAQTVGDHVRGTGTANGAGNTLPFAVTFPSTAIPTGTGATMDIPGTGKATIRPLTAGTWTVKAGAMAASLTFSSGGTDTTTLKPNCTAPTDGTQNLGTIKVSKDSTTTTAGATYSAAKKAATGTAKVKSHFGLTATGKVTFVLKKGTTKVASQTKSLSKGAAKAVFSGVKKAGKYSITATYGGNAALKGSSGKASFTVK